MQINTLGSRITITGHIKAMSDYQDIKNAVERITATNQAITIEIKDSISITSSVIGFLNKLVLKDNIKLTMIVGEDSLMNLLDELNLTQTFNAVRANR